MKIRELKLLYFRNYTSLNIATHPSLNIFFGDNANGKTNIVESIFCLSFGKSYRTKSDTECIMFGEDAAAMSCVLNKNSSVSEGVDTLNDIYDICEKTDKILY